MARVPKRLVGASFFLPDEIVVQIISKVTELRTLCSCKCVSKLFYQIACQVTCQVDTISFMAPSSWKAKYSNKFHEHVFSLAVSDNNLSRTRTGKRFNRLVDGLVESMTKFTRLKSLYIELPIKSSFKRLPFLKWKAFIGDRNGINSFVVLSPTSIKRSSYVDDHEKEKTDLRSTTYPMMIAHLCLEEAFIRYMMLFGFARKCPFLEKITITDTCKRGMISLSGSKLSAVTKLTRYTAPPNVINFHHKVSRCRIPLLDLPVSGFVMKGVKLILYEDVALPSGYSYDGYITHDDDYFDGKEKAAYSEAMREIFNKHKDKISQSPPQCRCCM